MRRRNLVLAVLLGGALVLAAAAVFASLVLAVRNGDGLGLGDQVAVLPIEGLIVDDRNQLDQLRRFRENPSVRAFVVAINSPGGVVGPSQSLYRELRRLRDEDERPVVASIGAVGASGGYYVALGADSILALPGSLTGSIGVIMEFPNAAELLDRVGIDMQVVKSSEHKDIGSPFRELSAEDEALLQSLVADVYDQFVGTVAEERGLNVEQVRPLADGRILSGRQAIAAGLVDREGNLQDAVEMAGRMAGLGARPRVRYPPEKRFGLLDLLLGRAASGAGALDRLVRPWEQVGPRLKFVMPY